MRRGPRPSSFSARVPGHWGWEFVARLEATKASLTCSSDVPAPSATLITHPWADGHGHLAWVFVPKIFLFPFSIEASLVSSIKKKEVCSRQEKKMLLLYTKKKAAMNPTPNDVHGLLYTTTTTALHLFLVSVPVAGVGTLLHLAEAVWAG